LLIRCSVAENSQLVSPASALKQLSLNIASVALWTYLAVSRETGQIFLFKQRQDHLLLPAAQHGLSSAASSVSGCICFHAKQPAN
jgi:hypothetical protein